MRPFLLAVSCFLLPLSCDAEVRHGEILPSHYLYSVHHEEGVKPSSTHLNTPSENLVAFNTDMFTRDSTLTKVHFDQKYANWLPNHEISIALPEPSTWVLLSVFFFMILAAKWSVRRRQLN